MYDSILIIHVHPFVGDVFEDTAPFAASVLDGYNVCIFAYGQTGSGKTYTMVRIILNPKSGKIGDTPGLILLFYFISLSYVERTQDFE